MTTADPAQPVSARALVDTFNRASEAVAKHASDHGVWFDDHCCRAAQRRWEQALARLTERGLAPPLSLGAHLRAEKGDR